MINFQLKKIKQKAHYFTAIAFLALPILARADLPAGNAVTLDDVDGILGIIARFMIVMSMVVAVIFMVLGGIMIMTAQADPGRFKTGTAWVRNVVIGSAVVLGSGVIMNTIVALVDRSFFCQISLLGVCLY